jgi:hypothetical protein
MSVDHGSAPNAAPPKAARTRNADADPILESPPLAHMIERLSADFASQLPLPVVLATIRHCRRELDFVAGLALPELVERLARQRLHDLVTTRSTGIKAGNAPHWQATTTSLTRRIAPLRRYYRNQLGGLAVILGTLTFALVVGAIGLWVPRTA